MFLLYHFIYNENDPCRFRFLFDSILYSGLKTMDRVPDLKSKFNRPVR